MINIASLISLCETVLAGGNKAADIYRKKKFTQEEKNLLVAASKEGKFHFLSVDQIPGVWVRADSKDFLDDEDSVYAAIHLEAFQSLCSRGYVVHGTGKLFMLTGSGFKKAGELAKR